MSEYIFDYQQYKKNIHKKSHTSIILLIVLIVILFTVATFLQSSSCGTFEFYFVEVDSFQTYTDANCLSQELHNNNAPGYIHFDNKYHVLACFFTDYDDAESVVENLKNAYKNAKVFTISANQINKNNYSFDPNKTIKNLILSTNKIINQLNDISIAYDKQELSFNETSIQLLELKKENEKFYNEFCNYFKNDYTLNSAKKYANKINSSLNILTNNPEDTLSFSIKNELIKIVINHSSFLSCF